MRQRLRLRLSCLDRWRELDRWRGKRVLALPPENQSDGHDNGRKLVFQLTGLCQVRADDDPPTHRGSTLPCRDSLYSCRWERISNPNPKFDDKGSSTLNAGQRSLRIQRQSLVCMELRRGPACLLERLPETLARLVSRRVVSREQRAG